MMDAAASSSLNSKIAQRVRELRAARRFSLEELSSKTGVSRSMISLIERGETSATAVILEKLSAGLGVPLAALFDLPTGTPEAGGPLARRKDQSVWTDPESGYMRRNVSPVGAAQPMRIVEVEFPPAARVAFDHEIREVKTHQQIWVLEGTMEITVHKERHRLEKGDCLAMVLDGPTHFHNPGRRAARYVVVISNEFSSAR